MFQNVDESMFIAEFERMKRSDNFSRAGLRALFKHLIELEDDFLEEFELDVIALCCDYSEIDVDDLKRETGCETLEELREETTVIEVDDETIIYQAF